ncbi:MAG: TRAM domain-containing protein [Candidatus Saccharibacteria bacterium]|nr:TRAM domain-containing protein [Candidatus Saccharibacteria bacterium]
MEIIILIITLLILTETTLIFFVLKDKLNKKSTRRKVYIDTSALMDGRILAIAQSGFLADELIIPRSVIREMQLLADGSNTEKRNRARRGMDNVNELERVEYCDVKIFPDELNRTPVDERLISLAHENHGAICTVDYNLAKVALTENIDVLNVNELAMVLRSEYLPGDKVKIKINTAGTNPGQGVGHLEDGTMVVVDNAARRVGQEVTIEIIRFLQTSAGRMMFARLVRENNHRKKKS